MIGNLSTPLPPAPGRDGDFDRLVVLIHFLSDPKACSARLAEITLAHVEASEDIAAAKRAKSEMESERAALKAERAAHDQQLASERQSFEEKCNQRDSRINDRQREAESLYAKAKATNEEAERAHAELKDRLERVKAAAAS